MSYEESNKLEHGCEQLIKRIEKAYIDIDPKNKLENMKVESKQGSNGSYSILHIIYIIDRL